MSGWETYLPILLVVEGVVRSQTEELLQLMGGWVGGWVGGRRTVPSFSSLKASYAPRRRSFSSSSLEREGLAAPPPSMD